MLMDAKWLTVVRFTLHYRFQVSLFNLRLACSRSKAIDSFNWVCPSTVPRALRHMQSCKAREMLIVPEWSSAIYWPLLCNKCKKFACFNGEVFVLPKIKDLIIEGSGQKEVYKRKPSAFSGRPWFNILATKLDL